VEVRDLKVGDRVLLSDGKEVAISGIKSYNVDATKVYNFEVADNHTYFVGEDGVLVHNYGPFVVAAIAAGAFFTAQEIGENSEDPQDYYLRAVENAQEFTGLGTLKRIIIGASKKVGKDYIKSDKENQQTRRTDPLTKKEAKSLAQDMGYKEVKDPPFKSHGQPVFKKGTQYISPDRDIHKGGSWKVFDSKGNRIGTYNDNLSIKVGN
jgi:hypothetical protein